MKIIKKENENNNFTSFFGLKDFDIKKLINLKFNNFYKKITIQFLFLFILLINFPSNKLSTKFDVHFEYHNYQRSCITDKMVKYAGWQQLNDQPYFINGIIRKLKPKNCLEIGVAEGGSAILILNALKDINNSRLVSLDVSAKYYANQNLTTGYRVKKYFPELINKWQLFTGEQPHIFLEKLNLQFDFLFLDTVHFTPGELINFIEALPFLKDNAIVVLHDILFHLPSNGYYNPKFVKYHPSQIFLMTSLIGEKIIIKEKDNNFDNIGAVCLYPNQKKYYLNYFLLLLTPWEYIPVEKHIKELQIFIGKFYRNKIYLDLFNKAIQENTIYVNKFKILYNNQ